MKLLYQTHSPYARKVLVAAHEIGLASRLEVIHHETSPTRRNEAVYAVNPLGKVPVLLRDDGSVLFDSNVICEYLDGLHDGPKLIPAQATAHYGVLLIQALAQGISDAGIAARWDIERRPEALRWPVLVEAYREKIAATCDYLEREFDVDAVDLGAIALATALSWIEFREVYDFRVRRPRLAAWYERFAQRPSMRATALSGATHD
ncbi:glutathione S-transferase family protein [Dyella sp. 2RAB6]|uniref:glutathione S-transferase family protein n=1 Tax=Dyella sp. 2RAB6 TaxID=3232992 RepID=UPI003F8E2BA7